MTGTAGAAKRTPASATAVVCALLDDAAEAEVLNRMAALARAGLGVLAPPRHRPHLSLGAAHLARSDVASIEPVLARVAGRTAGFAVTLEHLGIFPRGGVLWLGPRPEPALFALQRDVDTDLLAAGLPRAFGAQSDPGHWVAHVTLATRLRPEALGRAVTMTSRRRPVPARVEALGVILVGGRGEEVVVRLA